MRLDRAARIAALTVFAAIATIGNGQESEPAPLPPPSEALTPEESAQRAGYGHQTDRRSQERFDPNIFTDLSPVTIDEAPVKLPKDQEYD